MFSNTPPVHPQPGFYETTVAQGGSPDVLLYPIDHEKVEEILARPKWSLEMAKARVDGKIAAHTKVRSKRPRTTR